MSDVCPIERSMEEVRSLLHHASVREDELRSETQVLRFSPSFHMESKELVLLELDPKLLDTLKEEGSVVLRGDPQEGAVLCTRSKTYEVREALTSNSMLLVPELRVPEGGPGERTLSVRQVPSNLHSYLEVRPCRPRLHKLRHLLEENLYCGREHEEKLREGPRYTTSDLLERVQCSEEELEAGLRDLDAYELHGFWHLLELRYHFKIVSHITKLMEAKSWAVDGVPRDEAMLELSKLEPTTIMDQCFDYFLLPTHQERDDGDILYALRGEKLCRFFGEVLLKSSGRMELEEFLNIWQRSVPEGLTTSLGQLKGLVLPDCSGSPAVIHYFPVTSLPLDVKERFQNLFDLQSKWTFEEIQPFLEDVVDEKTPVNTLLTKHARASTVGGVKYYTGRYAK